MPSKLCNNNEHQSKRERTLEKRVTEGRFCSWFLRSVDHMLIFWRHLDDTLNLDSYAWDVCTDISSLFFNQTNFKVVFRVFFSIRHLKRELFFSNNNEKNLQYIVRWVCYRGMRLTGSLRVIVTHKWKTINSKALKWFEYKRSLIDMDSIITKMLLVNIFNDSFIKAFLFSSHLSALKFFYF